MKEESAIIFSDGLNQYDFGEGHPFRGDRYEMFSEFLLENLSGSGIYDLLQAEPATDEDLLRICSREYIDFTREYFNSAETALQTTGSFTRFHSTDNAPRNNHGKLEEAARLIIGQAKLACDLVSEGEYKKVISIGGGLHHAKPGYGEGFCIYNDVAFCGKYLSEKYNYSKILIIDTDAHAGNGTCAYFYDSPAVLFIDLHQDPATIYPGTGFSNETGSGDGKGYTINLPMPVYAGSDSYAYVFNNIINPVVDEFRPQVIIRNGGSDPHRGDILTNLGLTLDGLHMIGSMIRELSNICDGKVIDLVASGYNLDILPHGWLSLITGLLGIEISVDEPIAETLIPSRYNPLETTKRMVDEVKNNLKDYWSCFG